MKKWHVEKNEARKKGQGNKQVTQLGSLKKEKHERDIHLEV